MTRILMLLLGALATVTFAALILVAAPSLIIPKPATPTAITDSTKTKLQPYTASQLRGRAVYISNGCIYCHSQQVRDAAISTDTQRGWGRPSYPSDYIFDNPPLLGTSRTGPDLINVGSRVPDRNWHYLHLFQPRAVNAWSVMPAFPFLFELKDKTADGDEVVSIPESLAPKGKVVISSQEVRDLVDYILSLKRDFPPPELEKGVKAQ